MDTIEAQLFANVNVDSDTYRVDFLGQSYSGLYSNKDEFFGLDSFTVTIPYNATNQKANFFMAYTDSSDPLYHPEPFILPIFSGYSELLIGIHFSPNASDILFFLLFIIGGTLIPLLLIFLFYLFICLFV
jgi:hypothetical protein